MSPGLIAALCCTLIGAPTPFAQDWSDTGLITADDDWSSVPAIVGYRGDGLAAEPGTDPKTVVADGSTTPVDVAANRTDPGALGVAAGVAEFELEDPVVAIQGSATASAPQLVIASTRAGGRASPSGSTCATSTARRRMRSSRSRCSTASGVRGSSRTRRAATWRTRRPVPERQRP